MKQGSEEEKQGDGNERKQGKWRGMWEGNHSGDSEEQVLRAASKRFQWAADTKQAMLT